MAVFKAIKLIYNLETMHNMTIISFFPPYRSFQSTIHNFNDIIFKSDFIVISRLFNKTDLIHQHQIILCMIYLCDNDIKGHPFIVIIYLYPNHHIGSVPAGTPTSETTWHFLMIPSSLFTPKNDFFFSQKVFMLLSHRRHQPDPEQIGRKGILISRKA